jgi:hypothetical protein
MEELTNIPATAYENPPATASQLTILLDAATAAVGDEVRRTERIERKIVAQAGFTAALLLGGHVLVAALVAVLIVPGDGSSFVPFVAALAAVATIVSSVALGVSFRSWRLFDESTVALSSIGGSDYLGAALVGNPRVGINMVQHYAEIAMDRRTVNDGRVRALTSATTACFLSSACVAAEIALAFVAVAVR